LFFYSSMQTPFLVINDYSQCIGTEYCKIIVTFSDGTVKEAIIRPNDNPLSLLFSPAKIKSEGKGEAEAKAEDE